VEELQQILEELREDLLSSFLSPKIKSSSLKHFVNNNIDNWTHNALLIQEQYTFETSFYLTELLRSDFTVSFFVKSFELSKNEKITLKDKVDFIHNNFEFAYFYYSFIAFCHNYRLHYFEEEVYSNWFKPYKAKEFPRSGFRKWEVNGKITSGKNWTLHACPLFNYSPQERTLIKRFRNDESHCKLVVVGEKIFLLDNKDTIEVSQEAEELFDFLNDAINISGFFITQLLLKHHFWIPSVILCLHGEKLNYNVRTPIFSEVFSILSPPKKKKINLKSKQWITKSMNLFFALSDSLDNLLENTINHKKVLELGDSYWHKNPKVSIMLAVIGYILYFLNFDIWKILKNKKILIDSLFINTIYRFDITELKKYNYSNIDNIKGIIIYMERQIRIHILNEELSSSFKDELEEKSLDQIIHDFLSFILVNEQKLAKDSKNTLVFGIMMVSILLFQPISLINDSLDKAIK